MIPTTLPAFGVPRAAALTDVLVAPAGPLPAVGDLAALARQLQQDLAAAAGRRGGPLRVGAHQLRGTPTGGRPAGGEQPFRWSARTARRSIGVVAAGRCAGGRCRTPAEAVEAVVAQLADRGRQERARPGSLAGWLSTLAPAGRAVVVAEATTWATHLWSAVEWDRLPHPPVVGGADRWWDCPSAPSVGLRGRADVRVPTDGGGGPSLLTVAGGRPEASSRLGLGLAALVDVLRGTGDPVAARVVGWWPECGRALVLAVDLPLLRATAAAVVGAVRAAGAGEPVRLAAGRG